VEHAVDFLVVGAQRSGTTSLRSYLADHPGVVLSRSKEAPFFSHDPTYRRGLDAYLRREFPRKAKDAKRGTVTPQYLAGGVFEADPETTRDAPPERVVPARIREQLPRVRILAVLRDPVERLLSHYRLNLWRGWERRSLAEMVREELGPAALADARRHPADLTGYVVRGEYGRILGPYFELFDREQLWIGFSAALEDEPRRFMRDAFAHIGVATEYEPRNLGRRYHRSGETWIGGSLLRKATWRRLIGGKRLPPDQPVWRRFVGGRSMAPSRLQELSEPTPELVAELRNHYEEDRSRLESLLSHPVQWDARPEVPA
jgi:hypothetical protein